MGKCDKVDEFRELYHFYSDEKLEEILINRDGYEAAAVKAAIDEAFKRDLIRNKKNFNYLYPKADISKGSMTKSRWMCKDFNFLLRIAGNSIIKITIITIVILFFILIIPILISGIRSYIF